MSEHDIILLLSIITAAPIAFGWYWAVSAETRKRLKEYEETKAQAERDRLQYEQQQWANEQREKQLSQMDPALRRRLVESTGLPVGTTVTMFEVHRGHAAQAKEREPNLFNGLFDIGRG